MFLAIAKSLQKLISEKFRFLLTNFFKLSLAALTQQEGRLEGLQGVCHALENEVCGFSTDLLSPATCERIFYRASVTFYLRLK